MSSKSKKRPKPHATSSAPRQQPPEKTAGSPGNSNLLRLEYIDPATLTDNPDNWRRHPESQLAALDDLLNDADIGWAGVLLYNARTKHLLDGHARKTAWLKKHPGLPVPVVIGSWSPEAEKKILLTLDPLAGLATPDVGVLSRLLEEVPLTTALSGIAEGLAQTVLDATRDLQTAAENRVKNAGKSRGPGAAGSDADANENENEKFGIVVTCTDEAHQQALLEQFTADGLECRALVS